MFPIMEKKICYKSLNVTWTDNIYQYPMEMECLLHKCKNDGIWNMFDFF